MFKKALFTTAVASLLSLNAVAGGTHAGGDKEGHAHDAWPKPPAKYMNKTFDGWNDPTAAARGKEIYQANCASCHGMSGKGDGPVASSLEHPPANLTQHFHMMPGIMGDQYLFWRVTEGGQVEPFKSTKSAMPAFKNVLSEKDRWNVLAYVHQEYHKTSMGMKEMQERGAEHEAGHDKGQGERGSHHQS